MGRLRDTFVNICERTGIHFPVEPRAEVDLPELLWGTTPFDRVTILADPGVLIDDPQSRCRFALLRIGGKLRYSVGSAFEDEIGVLADVRAAVQLAVATVIEGRALSDIDVPRGSPDYPALGPPFEGPP